MNYIFIMRIHMKRITHFCLGLFVATVSFAQTHDPGSARKEQIKANLKSIEDTYFKYLNFEERRIAIDLMNRTIALVDDANLDSSALGDRAFNTLDEKDMPGLLQQLNGTIGASEKLSLLKSVSIHAWFLSSQVRSIVDTFTFDDDKVSAIKQVYDRIIDKKNLSVLLPAIGNPFVREKLSKYFQTH
jgi:hypothetical protein